MPSRMTDYEMFKQAGLLGTLKLNNKEIKTINATLMSEDQFYALQKIKDREDAVSRFKWFNLPKGITAELIERILYLKGQGMLFKMADKFYFLPYTLSSKDNTGIDCYSRYKQVTPVSMGSVDSEGKKIFDGQSWDVVYDINEDENIDENTCCVLLHDYTPGINQTNISRERLQECIIKMQSDLFPYMKTALKNRTGIRAMRVDSEDSADSVESANGALEDAAKTGRTLIPIVGSLEFQDLSGGNNVGDPSEFMSAYQSLENFRKQNLGIATDGMMQKNQHVLEGEHEMNSSMSGGVMNDALYQRQMFCVLAESIWHLGIWCVENKTLQDTNVSAPGVENDGGDENADID